MAAPNNTLGTDLRSMDFQSAIDICEPMYVTSAQKLFNVQKCPSEMTKDDLPKHAFETKNFLNDQYKGDIRQMGFLFGVLTEDKEGNVLGPTERLVMIDQMKRSVCGDRFWFSNGFALSPSKFYSFKVSQVTNFIIFKRTSQCDQRIELQHNHLSGQ